MGHDRKKRKRRRPFPVSLAVWQKEKALLQSERERGSIISIIGRTAAGTGPSNDVIRGEGRETKKESGSAWLGWRLARDCGGGRD